MAWLENLGITGGVLAGKNIAYDAMDGDDKVWMNAPRPGLASGMMLVCGIQNSAYHYVDILGIDIMGLLPPLNSTITLAEIPLKGSDTQTYAVTARCSTSNTDGSNYEIIAYLRTWDSTHTTFTQVQKSQIAGFYAYAETNRYNTTRAMYFVCGKMTYQGQDWFVTGITSSVQAKGDSHLWTRMDGFATYLSTFKESILGGGEFDPSISSDEYGKPSEPGGGYNSGGGHGSFDDSSDTIRLQPKPSIGVTSVGFINVYKVTEGQLQNLGEKIFPSISQMVFGVSNPTIQDVLLALAQITMGGALTGGALPIAQTEIGLVDILLNGKLIDYIVDCHVIPTSVSGATVEGLKVGYKQFNEIQVARATEDYVDVDCGNLSIPEYWGNFLDFQTQTELYLPFVGFVPIDCEMYIGGTLNVMYRVNIVDGSFVCCVYASSGKSELSQSLIGHYMGVCCVHFPITGLQYSNVVSGLISSAATMGVGATTGDAGGVVSGALNLLKMQPDRPMSNGYNASGNFMAKRKPYLVIKRPVAQFSEKYPDEAGLPLVVARSLGSMTGLTVCENPILDGVTCTEAEKAKIRNQLASEGLIL